MLWWRMFSRGERGQRGCRRGMMMIRKPLQASSPIDIFLRRSVGGRSADRIRHIGGIGDRR